MAVLPPNFSYPQQPFTRTSPRNGMGTASLVLGIIALAISFIPFIGLFISIPLGIIGVILAIVCFVRISSSVARNKGVTIAGVITSGLAIIVAISSTIGMSLIASSALSSSDSGNQTQSGTRGLDSESSRKNPGKPESSKALTFPGHKDGDTIGTAGSTLKARGVKVTAQKLVVRSQYGSSYLCSKVKIKNESDERQSYNTLDWSLQSPTGDIQEFGFSGSFDDALNSGDLAPGGTTKGAVCFDKKHKAKGKYVLLFEGFINWGSGRAAWINNL